LTWASPDPKQANVYQIFIHWKHLALLGSSAVLFAIVYAANLNNDWLLSALRWIKVTERTARKTIWNDAFQEFGGTVQVGLSGERRILGWLRYYSDEAEESSLFLESAAWVTTSEDGTESEQPIDGPGILLTKESGIEYVMFLNWRKSEGESE
jgi:hypothetical protein